jgi:hypothetical protein
MRDEVGKARRAAETADAHLTGEAGWRAAEAGHAVNVRGRQLPRDMQCVAGAAEEEDAHGGSF